MDLIVKHTSTKILHTSRQIIATTKPKRERRTMLCTWPSVIVGGLYYVLTIVHGPLKYILILLIC